MSLGTALLSDGFYAFDLYNGLSAPYWYDEYSVGSTGTAGNGAAAAARVAMRVSSSLST